MAHEVTAQRRLKSSGSILLVDDDEGLLELLSMRLTSAGYSVQTQKNGFGALALLEQTRPSLMITDLRMDAMDGMALFSRVRVMYPTLPVIILTAHGSIPEAVEATQNGVFSFLTKPFDSRHLLEVVSKAVDLGAGVANADAACSEQHGIVTENPRMLQLLSKLRLVANTHSNILFHGESGTGKELFARAVHKQSTRASGPFVALNCAALPEGVLESELFGHLRGAFTGAIKDRPGLFRAADGGTLFLDEIGDMPVHFQPRLLRALEERQITPVGGTVPVPVNIRLISATHQPVNKLVETQGFRSDLLYRINTVTLEIPPLRERPEDIRLLARHFLQEIALKEQRQVNSFSAEALELLVLATWPGNVRQLHNVVEQVVALTTGPVVSADLVTAALQGEVNDLLPLADARQEFERRYLLRVLKVAEGNVARAAQLAHRNRTEFYRLMRRHHLNNHSFKSGVERS